MISDTILQLLRQSRDHGDIAMDLLNIDDWCEFGKLKETLIRSCCDLIKFYGHKWSRPQCEAGFMVLLRTINLNDNNHINLFFPKPIFLIMEWINKYVWLLFIREQLHIFTIFTNNCISSLGCRDPVKILNLWRYE